MSTPDSAVRAAVSAAAALGIHSAEPAVLGDAANVIVHLRPAPVVAKVAASTAVIRDVAAWLQRELDVAGFLTGEGAPVLAPSPDTPAVVHHAEGHVMSFWRYQPPSGSGRPDEATIGSMLRDLHAVLRGYPGSMPELVPLGDIPAFLAEPRVMLTPDDTAALSDAFARLSTELAAELDGASGHSQVLHGDAGPGNLMATGAGWVWHDFEDTCSGPVAWDLAAPTTSRRLDGARVLAAYADPVDPGQLSVCQQLRRLNMTVWYALYAERLPEQRQRAADLLATWRT
jgi:aminoglycoside phosphotransferase (APT) family kinase protein